jgi:hypothetical protein
MNTVLIAHYNKDISWVKEINKNINVKIYSTSDPSKTYVMPNKGMDANMYLRYIIDNYDSLPERTLFVHHHKTDWTQDYDMPFIINNVNWELDDYFSVCARKNYDDVFVIDPRTKQWIKDAWFLFEKYIPFPKEMFYFAGTQFMCHKKLLLQYPKHYWQSLYSWLMMTPLPDYLSARIFEWTWHYILTKNPIEKKYENNQIFKL